MKKEDTKEVTWQPGTDEERVFIVKRFTAFKGLTILKKILTMTLPIDLLSMIDKQGILKNQISLPQSDGGGREMSDRDFMNLCRSILRESAEKLPSGATPVMDDLGNFRVNDLEYNLDLTIFLMVHILIFNYKDFFIGGLSKLSPPTGDENNDAPNDQK